MARVEDGAALVAIRESVEEPVVTEAVVAEGVGVREDVFHAKAREVQKPEVLDRAVREAGTNPQSLTELRRQRHRERCFRLRDLGARRGGQKLELFLAAVLVHEERTSNLEQGLSEHL
jgi:hypothetical protein